MTVSTLLLLLQVMVYSEVVEKSQHVAKAIMANNHSKHLIKPLGSFNTLVSMTVVPMGCKIKVLLFSLSISDSLVLCYN